MAKRKCKAKTKAGKACRNGCVEGADACIAHLPRKARESLGFGGAQEGGGRARKPRVVDVVRERIEDEMDDWYGVLVDARQAMRTVVVPQGEGKPSKTVKVPDHPVRLKAFAEAMDRAYGRPVQATEVSGPDGTPLAIDRDLSDPAVSEAMLAAAKAIDASRRTT